MHGKTDASHIIRYCHNCGKQTGSFFKHVPAGIGQACDCCGAFRKRKPYVSKDEFNTLMATVGKGGKNGLPHCCES